MKGYVSQLERRLVCHLPPLVVYLQMRKRSREIDWHERESVVLGDLEKEKTLFVSLGESPGVSALSASVCGAHHFRSIERTGSSS